MARKFNLKDEEYQDRKRNKESAKEQYRNARKNKDKRRECEQGE
jgi:hypothetical protein